MSTSETHQVFGDIPAANPQTVAAISSLMETLMGAAAGQGDPHVALNALLGAYVNLALRPTPGVSASKAIQALGTARDQVLSLAFQPKTAQAAGVSPTDARRARTAALASRISASLSGQPHDEALEALINLFYQGAVDNLCCATECAAKATHVAQLITERVAAAGQSSTHVH